MLFKNIVYYAIQDAGTPEGRLVKIWLSYEEVKTRAPLPGFEVCEGDQMSRVQETFRIEIGERPSVGDRQDQVSVAGARLFAQDVARKFDPSATLLYDESVPFQEFPEQGQPSRWLILLGHVRVGNQILIFTTRYFGETYR